MLTYHQNQRVEHVFGSRLIIVDDIFLTDEENVVNDIESFVEIPDDPVG